MKSQYIYATLILLTSLSACIPPRPVTQTPIPTIASSEIPAPTDVPPPANTPAPSVQITNPVDNGILNCDNPDTEAFCLFHVQGKIGGVGSFSDYRLYVFIYPVTPPGAGWYLQEIPASIESNGNWEQAPAYLGNATFPAVAGNTLKIRAVLVKSDATFNGSTLADLANSSDDPIVLLAVEDIEGDVAVSDIVDVELKK